MNAKDFCDLLPVVFVVLTKINHSPVTSACHAHNCMCGRKVILISTSFYDLCSTRKSHSLKRLGAVSVCMATVFMTESFTDHFPVSSQTRIHTIPRQIKDLLSDASTKAKIFVHVF